LKNPVDISTVIGAIRVTGL